MLQTLFTHGRHTSSSTKLSTQKFTDVAQILRVNAKHMFVYRLRHYEDLYCVLDEVSGTVGRKAFVEMHNLGTTEPYSVPYINLVSSKIMICCICFLIISYTQTNIIFSKVLC